MDPGEVIEESVDIRGEVMTTIGALSARGYTDFPTRQIDDEGHREGPS